MNKSIFKKLKKVELDEIEMYLRILEKYHKEQIKGKTYKQIAQMIQDNFEVKCNEQQVNLLYEPAIEEEIEDSKFYYTQVLGL